MQLNKRERLINVQFSKEEEDNGSSGSIRKRKIEPSYYDKTVFHMSQNKNNGLDTSILSQITQEIQVTKSGVLEEK